MLARLKSLLADITDVAPMFLGSGQFLLFYFEYPGLAVFQVPLQMRMPAQDALAVLARV